ncbi:MAG: pyridoxal phosphate-dependent aminotransferase [Spirochaetaceae bacterium]|nr:pyridoxal phosphate-dependent aminotransferase [Spirochaetaceae bacterium]
MAIAKAVKGALAGASMIRKMFEEGSELKKKHGAEHVFDFSIGNPDLEPPRAFHEALLRLAEEDKKGSHGYMSNQGFPDVREAIAKKASREQGVDLSGAHIIMSVGAAGALNVILKTILNPGDEVIVSAPYFMEYSAYTANHGGVLVTVDSKDDFNLDIAAIAKALGEKTAAVLINSPHNPTGRVYPRETLEELAALLREHGKKTGRKPYLLSDEPYREIVYGGVTVPPLLAVYEESLVATSYSKNLSLPGERIGYIAVNPKAGELDDLLGGLVYATRVLGYVNAPALMQRVVARLTEEKVAVDVYAARRDAFIEVLRKTGIEYAPPEGAFYLFCKVPRRGKDGPGGDGDFVQHLKKHLILGVPGSSFKKPGWVRFAYCVDETLIRASAEAFKNAVAQW